MTNRDTQFAGSIPEIYDRFLGPIIFQPYADDLARRLARLHAGSVLETAAGTGIVTRATLKALPANASITATDLNQPMLDYAERQTGPSRATWKQADATALPFADGTFDCVACQFGAMFFADKVAAYREALRVLNPGGPFVFNVWDSIESNDFAQVVTEAVATLFPADPPRFFARVPHGYHDVAKITGELQAAGFSRIKAETLTKRSVAKSAEEAATAFCQGTPLRNEIESRDNTRLNEATDVAAAALRQRFGNGEISANMQAHVIEAAR